MQEVPAFNLKVLRAWAANQTLSGIWVSPSKDRPNALNHVQLARSPSALQKVCRAHLNPNNVFAMDPLTPKPLNRAYAFYGLNQPSGAMVQTPT